MCYLIVKKRKSIGCYALKTKHGKELVELKKKINLINNELQVITISKPSAYGEYAPYYFVQTEDELLKLIETL